VGCGEVPGCLAGAVVVHMLCCGGAAGGPVRMGAGAAGRLLLLKARGGAVWPSGTLGPLELVRGEIRALGGLQMEKSIIISRVSSM
jgi:hypothetical protein